MSYRVPEDARVPAQQSVEYRVADGVGFRGLARPAGVDLRSGRVRAGRLLALPVAGVLLALWLIADPHTPDLAAQVYRVILQNRYIPVTPSGEVPLGVLSPTQVALIQLALEHSEFSR